MGVSKEFSDNAISQFQRFQNMIYLTIKHKGVLKKLGVLARLASPLDVSFIVPRVNYTFSKYLLTEVGYGLRRKEDGEEYAFKKFYLSYIN